MSKTKEISVLKLLLQDEDDASLVAVQSSTDRGRLSGARLEVVDRLLADLELQLNDAPTVEEAKAQLARLGTAISERSASIEGLAANREELAKGYAAAQSEESQTLRRLGDVNALKSRFNLLLEQYDSDLARLEMINEAGSLLGYFDSGACVFCGAEPEHQHLNESCEGDSTYFGESVQAERQKTSLLREDLISTLADLDNERNDLRRHLAQTQEQTQEFSRQLTAADRALRPHRGDLNELLAARSSVEKVLGAYEQVTKLEQMKVQIADESKGETAAAVSRLDLAALREFSNQIARRLEAWSIPDASAVRYDRNEQDIIASDQLRAAHGKGVRAILHAAFTIALAQYCFERELPHPGFIILDSPLVTYRPPDQEGSDDQTNEDAMDESVVAAFYEDVERALDGQVIIMENTDPPMALDDESTDVPFTKLATSGRYGFFPTTEHVQETLGPTETQS